MGLPVTINILRCVSMLPILVLYLFPFKLLNFLLMWLNLKFAIYFSIKKDN